MKKTLLIIASLLLVFTLVLPSCQSPPETDTKEFRLRLVKEIRALEKELGFTETENFLTYSEETEAYHYYFYTPNTELPYSLDDPKLQADTGTRESATIDLKKYDAYFYSIPAVAGVKTPVTKSLLREPLWRFIQIIFHEDWHEQIDLPLGVEEPSAEIVSYTSALLFTGKKFGQDAKVYNTLRENFNRRLSESQVYRDYYDRLSALYASFQAGTLSEAETLRRKEQTLRSMGMDIQLIWGAQPDQLNNAFIAYQMTYLRHLLLMSEVLSAQNFELAKTIRIFRAMPEQGASFGTLDEVKRIEKEVTNYLKDKLPK